MTYNVTIKPSGHKFRIEASEPILERALNEGLALPYGCRNGSCGSCIGKVLSGQFAYLDGMPSGITPQEQEDGKALFCQACPRSDLVIEVREVEAARDIVVRTLPCRVMSMKKLAPDVVRLCVKLPAADRLQFLAGQYIDIILRDGRRRGFSLANAPHADEFLELHIRHVPGGEFTTFVFQEMRDKTILRFQGPLGSFFLREDSRRPIIMMAGGTGFAPLKGMLEHIFFARITRPIHLYWGARALPDLYMNELPESWAEEHATFRYTPVLSEPQPADHWRGRTGLVHRAVAADYPHLDRHELYMSGPPAMINVARATFTAQGLKPEHLFFDSFDFAIESRTPA